MELRYITIEDCRKAWEDGKVDSRPDSEFIPEGGLCAFGVVTGSSVCLVSNYVRFVHKKITK